jgi:TOTE conflict system, Archaeo-Eukaryotic Primase domain
VLVDEKGNCRVAAIDIDDHDSKHPIDLVKLALEGARRNIPAVVCRSRNGGAHILFFFASGQPAKLVRARLKQIATALGYPDAEVFPKQNRVTKKNPGNALRAPYLGNGRSTTYGHGPDGCTLSFEQFHARAEEIRIGDLARLDDIDLTPAPESRPEAASKADAHSSVKVEPGQTIREGSRNNFLYHHAYRQTLAGCPLEVVKDFTRALNKALCEAEVEELELERTVFRSIERVTPAKKVKFLNDTVSQLIVVKSQNGRTGFNRRLAHHFPRGAWPITPRIAKPGRPRGGVFTFTPRTMVPIYFC